MLQSFKKNSKEGKGEYAGNNLYHLRHIKMSGWFGIWKSVNMAKYLFLHIYNIYHIYINIQPNPTIQDGIDIYLQNYSTHLPYTIYGHILGIFNVYGYIFSLLLFMMFHDINLVRE